MYQSNPKNQQTIAQSFLKSWENQETKQKSIEMETANEHRGEDQTSEEYQMNPRPNSHELVRQIIAIIESVKAIGDYRKTQRKECLNLVRRLKLFSPILEEIRDTIPDAGIDCLNMLNKAFQSAKKLLKMCHAGSKIYLALESEGVMVKFHDVYEKISQVVEGMPYGELGVSDEEREQVELLREQLRRAKKRTDTQDMELTMDLMVAISTNNSDTASVERLANKLDLHTVEELDMETLAIRKLVKERRGHSAENTQQIIHLLNKFKRLAGLEEDGMPKHLEKRPFTEIPHEFLCPITLGIMIDPVIVSTGQTYERESIQQWLDSNNQSCPKTGQILTHFSLAPNFALKNLIRQWCENNNFQLPEKEIKPHADPDQNPSATDAEILSTVQNLCSSKLNEQRDAVKKIRMLSKESQQNRILIANSGGIPALVQLISYPDSKIQEHAVTAILNLSIEESNKKLISKEDAIPAIVEILQTGRVSAQENSAAALFSLSMLDENKVKIGCLNGIPPLVDLLRNGTVRGKKDAITALFNLCLNHSNKVRAIEAGIVIALLKELEDKKLDMVNETLSLLLILASNTAGRQELGQLPFIETLVSLIRDGTPKNKECATAVLVELGSNNANLILAALQYGVYEYLVEVVNNGTERGQRKANSMLRLMNKAEQIP